MGSRPSASGSSSLRSPQSGAGNSARPGPHLCPASGCAHSPPTLPILSPLPFSQPLSTVCLGQKSVQLHEVRVALEGFPSPVPYLVHDVTPAETPGTTFNGRRPNAPRHCLLEPWPAGECVKHRRPSLACRTEAARPTGPLLICVGQPVFWTEPAGLCHKPKRGRGQSDLQVDGKSWETDANDSRALLAPQAPLTIHRTIAPSSSRSHRSI